MTMSEATHRYLYALVDADREDAASFSASGIEDRPVRVLDIDGIGAVVQNCEGLYDTEDSTQLRSWLLVHQRVIDDATEAFGTPLPLRFDTVFEGGDEAVRTWVQQRTEDIAAELARFQGHREYHVGVSWDPDPFEERVRETDDRLQEISINRDDGEGGTAFLREKQYDQRLAELRDQHRAQLEADLRDQIEPVAIETARQASASGPDSQDNDAGNLEQVCTIAVMAATDEETNLGDRLDDYVEAYDVEIRFTGPWPPYSFAPEFT